MIQDYARNGFNNHFKNYALRDQDKVLIYKDRSVYIKEMNQSFYLPSFLECKDFLDPSDLIYGFSLANLRYFICRNFQDISLSDYEFQSLRGFRQHYKISRNEIPFIVMSGWHLFTWYHTHKYCPICKNELVHDTNERMLSCPECHHMVFPRINPCVIACVIYNDRILLSKYAHRGSTGYALIAGYCEFGETIEETVHREVFEEVGLKVKNLRYYKSQPWGIDSNLLMGFFCELDGDESINLDTNELAMAQWFTRDELPVDDDGYSLTYEMIGVFKNQPEYFKK